MRSLAIGVASGDAEAVLDELLPLAPQGVHVLEAGEWTDLVLFAAGHELPEPDELIARCGTAISGVRLEAAPADWRERRMLVYRPLVIGARLLVRPAWAPAPAPDGALLDIVLEDGPAFGSGAHPTTRSCLELLCKRDPAGSLVDLGCGSGVLAIAAARLGWRPVIAVDCKRQSVAATRANADRNAVTIDALCIDLAGNTAPAAETVVANVPEPIHCAIASTLGGRVPGTVLATGFTVEDEEAVAGAYRGLGLGVVERRLASGWIVLVLERCR
jgi:ribosomal protein L11 methyltransferase